MAPTRELAGRYDIISLNETSRNQARNVAESLGYHWASTDTSENGANPYSNNAILSRYPIEEFRRHLLPFGLMIPWRRRVLEATLNIDGRPLHVFSAHVSFLPFERGLHLKVVGELFDKPSGPRLLCGDLNAAPSHEEVCQLTKSYFDSWKVKGQGEGLTFGTRFSLRRIDYIFASNHFDVQEAQMPPTRLPDGSYPSDHHPVAATLAI